MAQQTNKTPVDYTKPFWLVYLLRDVNYGCSSAEAVQDEAGAVVAAQSLARAGNGRVFIAEVTKAFEVPVKQVDLATEVPF